MTALLELQRLAVRFPGPRQGLFNRAIVHAVQDVTLSVAPGETLGLIGESGSGKSTTGRAVLGLVQPSAGSIRFEGEDLLSLRGARLAARRHQMNVVFQDPYSSLDPSMPIEDIVAESIDARGAAHGWQRAELVREALDQVGLDSALRRRYPREFSGGQRQRIAIARAIVLRPRLVVCDEPVSALDVSTKNQIMTLLQHYQREHGTAYLFISHDIGVVRSISQRIAVMYAGRIVESGPAERVCATPAHPYTAALVSASPIPSATGAGANAHSPRGRSPSPLMPSSGCPFQPRCPFAMDVCRTAMPAPRPVTGGGSVACHLHDLGPKLDGRSVNGLFALAA